MNGIPLLKVRFFGHHIPFRLLECGTMVVLTSFEIFKRKNIRKLRRTDFSVSKKLTTTLPQYQRTLCLRKELDTNSDLF